MVKTLHLLRHAKSSWKHRELADHDRPLSKRGRRAVDAMARRFAELGVPDLVLCSTALRTRQTLKRVSAGLKPAKVVPPRSRRRSQARVASHPEWIARLRCWYCKPRPATSRSAVLGA